METDTTTTWDIDFERYHDDTDFDFDPAAGMTEDEVAAMLAEEGC